jgi:carbonic anhydrase
MGNAGETFHMLGLDLLHQLGHAGCGARTLQALAQAVGIRCLYSHTTGVITAILQSLQTLDQNRNDIAMRHRSNNATHRGTP